MAPCTVWAVKGCEVLTGRRAATADVSARAAALVPAWVSAAPKDGGQLSTWAIERAMRKARGEVKGLPAGFRYHDLRHYFASLLIADGAKTTLDTYGHIWPDRDESTRATVDAVLTAYLTEQRRNSATGQP